MARRRRRPGPPERDPAAGLVGSSVFLLPAAQVGWRELVTVFGADLDHAGVVLAAALHLIADRVVALNPRHERLQLFHGHERTSERVSPP